MAKINVRDRNKNKLDKKPNWEFRFEAASVAGKRKHISKSGFRTKKEALEAGALAISEYNSAGIHFVPSEISVNDYLDHWHEQYCVMNLKYNTVVMYKIHIDTKIKPYLGQYKLKSLTPSVLQDFANAVSKKGYALKHVMNIILVLKAALDYAVFPLNYIKTNPMLYIRYPVNGKKPQPKAIVSREEFEKIIKQFPFGDRMHIALLLGWHCGLRISEALAITWDDIDFNNKTININKQLINRRCEFSTPMELEYNDSNKKTAWFFTSPKYDSNRVIRIGSHLIDALKNEKKRQEATEEEYGRFYTIYIPVNELDKNGGTITRIAPVKKYFEPTKPCVKFVCIDRNGILTTRHTFNRTLNTINKLLGKSFGFHALRHAHATLLIENGVNPKVVQQRLGHKNISTTLQIYVGTTDKMHLEATEILDNMT